MQSFHGTYLRTHVQQRLQVVQASRKSPSNSIARTLLLSHFFVPFELLRSSNEFQLPLKIHPIFANEKGIKKIESSDPFEKLGKYYDCLPLPCGRLTIVLNNKFLQPNKTNNTFHKGFS